MANVCLCWELGGGFGHCVNLEPIAAELSHRGHKVTVVARSIETARRAIGKACNAYIQAPEFDVAKRLPTAVTSYPSLLFDCGYNDANELRRMIDAWRDIFEQADPSLLVFEHSPTAQLASRWFSSKRAAIGTGYTIPPSVSPMPHVKPSVTGSDPAEPVIIKYVNEILRDESLTELCQLSQLLSDVDESCLLTFNELDHYSSRTPETTYYGAWSLAGGQPPEWPAGTGRRVFCYLHGPPMFHYAGPVLAALGASGLSVLAHVPGFDETLGERLPVNVRIVNQPVDIFQAARECDFAVTNGNHGVCAQLLLAGVPLLMIPAHNEQDVFCRRVAAIGAGVSAYAWDPQTVVHGIATMLQRQSLRQQARAFSKKYASFDPAAAATTVAERIANLVEG
jgi:hypothetical protein